jgi:hypothetical protein
VKNLNSAALGLSIKMSQSIAHQKDPGFNSLKPWPHLKQKVGLGGASSAVIAIEADNQSLRA